MGNQCSFKVFPGQNEGKQDIVEGLGKCRRGATKWLFLGFRDCSPLRFPPVPLLAASQASWCGSPMAYWEVHVTILQIRKLRVDRGTTGIQLWMGLCKFLPPSWGRPDRPGNLAVRQGQALPLQGGPGRGRAEEQDERSRCARTHAEAKARAPSTGEEAAAPSPHPPRPPGAQTCDHTTRACSRRSPRLGGHVSPSGSKYESAAAQPTPQKGGGSRARRRQ